jgi:DNA-binding NarL/FixJ family response regulator
MIRLLIADEHMIVREGLKLLLAGASDIVIIDEAGSPQEVVDKVRENNPDMVLLEISMSDRSGLDILEKLKKVKPDLKILVLSMLPEEQFAIRAIKAGAFGYLTKKCSSNELIRAIRMVSIGKKYINYSIAEKLAYYLESEDERPLHESISNREYQVLRMITSGKTVSEIAGELSLSVKTISTYRLRILEKTKMKNNAQLIHYAVRNDLFKELQQ